MGTGIVSIGLLLDHVVLPSRILLVLCAAIWLALGGGLAARAFRDPGAVRHAARVPAALTGVAGTAVLGNRLALLGWTQVALALLVIALVLLLALLLPVLSHWRTPTTGASLVLPVSIQSLAVLSAELAPSERSLLLLDGALAAFALGVVAYAMVIARFDFREVGMGRGDQWITGGALAISTLAAADLVRAARGLGALPDLRDPLEVLAVVLWGMSLWWLAILLASEVLRRRLGYDLRRWATVFPLGMYAVCSFILGPVAHVDAMTTFARIWIWVATVVWALVFGATVGRLSMRLRGHPGGGTDFSR